MTFRKLDLLPFSGVRENIPTQLGPLDRADLNHWTEKSKNPLILNVIHHRQNRLEST
jgi:hypothetical protein